jgi:hypothetical protein
VLADWSDQSLERFSLRFCAARHDWDAGLLWLDGRDWVRCSSNRKSGKAMRGHLAPGTGCGLNIGAWSMGSLLDSETGEREEGRGGHRIQNGLPFQSWPNTAPRDGQGTESGGKRRRIRHPFHPDVQILRTGELTNGALFLRSSGDGQQHWPSTTSHNH